MLSLLLREDGSPSPRKKRRQAIQHDAGRSKRQRATYDEDEVECRKVARLLLPRRKRTARWYEMEEIVSLVAQEVGRGWHWPRVNDGARSWEVRHCHLRAGMTTMASGGDEEAARDLRTMALVHPAWTTAARQVLCRRVAISTRDGLTHWSSMPHHTEGLALSGIELYRDQATGTWYEPLVDLLRSCRRLHYLTLDDWPHHHVRTNGAVAETISSLPHLRSLIICPDRRGFQSDANATDNLLTALQTSPSIRDVGMGDMHLLKQLGEPSYPSTLEKLALNRTKLDPNTLAKLLKASAETLRYIELVQVELHGQDEVEGTEEKEPIWLPWLPALDTLRWINSGKDFPAPRLDRMPKLRKLQCEQEDLVLEDAFLASISASTAIDIYLGQGQRRFRFGAPDKRPFYLALRRLAAMLARSGSSRGITIRTSPSAYSMDCDDLELEMRRYCSAVGIRFTSMDCCDYSPPGLRVLLHRIRF